MARARRHRRVGVAVTAPELLEALDRTALLIRRDFYPNLTPGQIVEGLTGMHVRIVSDEANLATPAAQTFVTTTAIALTQTGARVRLDIPDVEIAGSQPPLPDTCRLHTGLVNHLRRLPAFGLGADNEVSVIVLVGDAAMPPAREGTIALRASGDDWNARVSSDGRQDSCWIGDQPFGGALAAVAICADVFRLAVARLGQAHGITAPDMFSLELAPFTVIGVEPIAKPTQALIRADFISAGAITNAAMMALSRVPGLRLRARAFDDDVVGLSNLNRYPLYNTDDLGARKPTALADVVPPAIEVTPVHSRFTRESAAEHAPLADIVLVGADDIPARWVAQEHSPGWLCVAGTTHFEIVISEHLPEGPCAGCIHTEDDPADGEIPTAAFVSLFAGILQAHRLLAYASTGETSSPVICWPLALGEANSVHSFGQVANAGCPVRCAAAERAAGVSALGQAKWSESLASSKPKD